MWLLALMVALVLVSLLRLTTRYEYGPRSVRLLKLVYAAGLVLSVLLVRFVFWPTLAPVYMILVAAAISLPLFTPLAALTVELLRKQKQAAYDQRLRELRQSEQDLLGEIEEATRRIRYELRLQEEAATAGRERQKDTAPHRARVEAWKHEGSVARIRSLKLEEWENELKALDPAGLMERRQALESELAAAGPERRAQIEVQISLSYLVGEGDGGEDSRTERRQPEKGSSRLVEKRRLAERALETVREDRARAERVLSDFLSREIKLD